MKNSITTKNGDMGQSKLGDGEALPKDDLTFELLGTIDELIAALGVARAQASQASNSSAIKAVQERLMHVAAHIAHAESFTKEEERFSAADLEELTERAAQLERQLRIKPGFVIPGDKPGSAHLHLARSISRRAERYAVRWARDREDVNKSLLPWLNRLSDYLWLLAVAEESPERNQRIYCLQVRR
jgi:cob(I)alamin adenosyltransferase